jgi:hypothetical protein
VTIDVDPWILITASGVVVAAIVLGWWLLARRRRARSLPVRLGKACDDLLASVLVPNGEAGHIHIEYALLTPREIVILDTRDVEGNVFGSEAMQEWTVLARNRRFTFANPLPALYDRLAAVKRLLPDVPVAGYVGFTQRATFSKGQPPNVVMLDHWIDGVRDPAAVADVDTEVLRAAWKRLRSAAENP